MGFSYADWSGVFYPADLPPHKRLAYYSRVFNGVEIDSTFYGIPRPASVRRWAASTPPDFRFCLKVPRQFTHEAGLVGVQGDLLKFIEIVQILEEKLGAVLFQFPPSFGPEQLPALLTCLAGLPHGLCYAVEIRHQSWYTAEYEPGGFSASEPTAGDRATGEPSLAQALRPLGVCWAATEYPNLPRRISATAEFLYLRWVGQHGTFQRHNIERIDRSAQLRQWQEALQPELSALSDHPRAPGQADQPAGFDDTQSGWTANDAGVLRDQRRAQAIYGFFNNDYAGFAAGTANRFKELAGLPVKPFLPPQQRMLF